MRLEHWNYRADLVVLETDQSSRIWLNYQVLDSIRLEVWGEGCLLTHNTKLSELLRGAILQLIFDNILCRLFTGANVWNTKPRLLGLVMHNLDAQSWLLTTTSIHSSRCQSYILSSIVLCCVWCDSEAGSKTVNLFLINPKERSYCICVFYINEWGLGHIFVRYACDITIY